MEENTNILCPDCFKGRIFAKDKKIGTIGQCKNCEMKFIIVGPSTVRYL